MAHDEQLTIGQALDLPCCQNHTSIKGLAPLMRHYPSRWHQILDDQCWDDVDDTTTLAEYLENGGGHLLCPRDARDRSIKKKRRGAHRVSAAFGELIISEITEADMRKLRRRYELAQQYAVKPDLLGSDMRVFRQAIHRAQGVLGRVRVKRTWGRSRPRLRADPPDRRHGEPLQVRLLLRECDPVLALGVALIVACGLLLGELLALMVSDVNVGERTIVVQHHQVRGWKRGPACRAVRIPDWAWPYVCPVYFERARRSRDALLVPSPRDETKPWANLGRALRRAAVRAGLQEKGASDPRWTATGLRRLYQEVARRTGLPRGLVRGTLVQGMVSEFPDEQLVWSQEESDKLANHWRYLLHPPGYQEGANHHVPRRAPAGVKPTEAEWPNPRTARWLRERARPAPLPFGCDEVPGMPERPAPRRSPANQPLASDEDAALVEIAQKVAAESVAEADKAAEAEEQFAAGAILGSAAGFFAGLNVAGKR